MRTSVEFSVLLRDNQGLPLANQTIVVSLAATLDGASPVQISVLTASNGTAWGNLTVPTDMKVGPTDIHAAYVGISGSTGIVGTNASSTFVVLAATEVVIQEAPSVLVAGDTMYVNGTLLDDLGLVLQRNGIDTSAVVHLLVDGVPVSSMETNATDGSYAFTYTLPEDTAAGPHQIGVGSEVDVNGLILSDSVTSTTQNTTFQTPPRLNSTSAYPPRYSCSLQPVMQTETPPSRFRDVLAMSWIIRYQT